MNTISKLALCALTLSMAAPAQAWSIKNSGKKLGLELVQSVGIVSGICALCAFGGILLAKKAVPESARELVSQIKNIKKNAQQREVISNSPHVDASDFISKSLKKKFTAALIEYNRLTSYAANGAGNESPQAQLIQVCDQIVRHIETNDRRQFTRDFIGAGLLTAVCGMTYAWLKK